MNKPFIIPGYPPELLDHLNEKLKALKEIEHDLPGVITIHNIPTQSLVYMSESGTKLLGVRLEDLQDLGHDYYHRYFNPEDSEDYVPKLMAYLENPDNTEAVSFYQQIRPQLQEWEWYLSCARVFTRDKDGKPLLFICISIPVDAQHHMATKAQRLLEENNFLRTNYHAFDQLTKREKEILKLMAFGLSSAEIASELHISEATATTHRRNIKSKLCIKSNYDITRFAQAFNLL